MNKNYEVCFTVFEDKDHTRTSSNLQYVTTIVSAFVSQQAQAMIESQYNGCAQVHSVIEVK